MILDVHPRLSCFSRMRSEGFVRLEWLVASSLGRRRVVVRSASRRRVVNSVSMGEAAKPLLFEGFQAGCHVVLRGRRGTLSHSNLFDNVSKVSKLEEVSHEMLVLLRPRNRQNHQQRTFYMVRHGYWLGHICHLFNKDGIKLAEHAVNWLF